MARACRFTAPYGSREIHHDGKPFINIQRALDKTGTGHSRPVDVDDTAREILAMLCGTRRSKSALAGGLGMWPFTKKKAKQLPRDPRRMAQTVMYVPSPSGRVNQVMRGAKRRRR